jgi:NADPH-dependent F420 reductase
VNIGVLGATGPAGRGLAARLATVGHTVIAGSRDRSRSEGVVSELRDAWGLRVDSLDAGTNEDAAKAGDLAVIATTWEGAVDTAAAHAEALAGKPVISMANGLEKVGREFRPVLPRGESLARAIHDAVPGAQVVAALQHIPAAAFVALDEPLQSDVVVCSDHDDAREVVMGLVAGIPELRAFDGGSLANAIGIEAFAAVLLTANLRHKGKGTLRLLGLQGYEA